MGFFAVLSRGIMVTCVQHPSMSTQHPEALPQGASCYATTPTSLQGPYTSWALGSASISSSCLPPPLSPPCLLTKGSTHPGLLVRFVVTSGHLLQLFHPSLRSEPSHLGRDSHLGSLVFHSSGSRYPAPLVAGVGCWSPLRPLLSDLPEDLFF